MPEYDLVADIGGTYSRLALVRNGEILERSLAQFTNQDATSFSSLVKDYLDGHRIGAACLAVAGVVHGNSADLTNHPWTIREADIPSNKTFIINDLQATAYSLSLLTAPVGARLAINLGTGLNAAVLHKVNGHWFAPASEAGYLRLPALEPDEMRVLRAASANMGAQIAEAVLSGRALPHLHHTLTGQTLTAIDISQNWPAPTATLFARALGAYLGDLALLHLPYAGIWLSGSLGRAAAPLLGSPAFNSTFLERGAYRSLLESIDLNILHDANAPLRGAAVYLQGQTARD